MGIDCYGWVEVRDPTSARGRERNPKWWSGVIRIDDIIERNYPVYGYFFGVRNPINEALASHRGLPTDVSQEVIREIDDPTDLAGATWLLWNELEDGSWRGEVELSAGWTLLFTLMEQLAANYGSERVRVIVWFDSVVGV